MRNWLIVVSGSLALAGCVPMEAQGDGMPPLPALAADQANPRLALLEHVLADYFASDITNRPTVCAAVYDGREEHALTPEEEVALIERFERLAPLSRCTLAAGRWRDAETEEPALVFSLHSFTCASEISCTGWAGYSAGAAASMSYLYTMEWGPKERGPKEREGAEWAFTRDPRALAQ
jgi:hypothetical protein